MDLTLFGSSSSSSSSSSTAVTEKDLLGRLSDSNFEDSGIDVNLTLRPPTSPIKKCCICGDTSTPLWRNGPKGPKTACNACGIRYRKDAQKLNTGLGLTLRPPQRGTQANAHRYRAP